MSLRAQIVRTLCAWLPKRNAATVYTWPAFDDTARALLPALAQSRVDRVYYLASSDVTAGEPPDMGPRVTVLPKRSLRGAWAFLTSRYVFTTHQCYTSGFPHNVVSVNLWHGMPIKRIGWMSGKALNLPHAQIELATSDFWLPIVQRCMRPWGEVWINGLPRTDRLAARSREDVRQQLGGEVAACRKLAVWLPTYRHTVLGDTEADGTDFHNEAQMPGFHAGQFDAWLAERNMACVIKPHPLGPRPGLRTTGHLRILDDATLGACGLTLYELLGGSDVLLTDVSSVYVDYMLLNRPVIHTFADREAYSASRGFTFDWTEDYFAGPAVEDMAGVERALDDLLAGRDAWATRRDRLRNLFHARPDVPATPTLMEKLGLRVSAGSAPSATNRDPLMMSGPSRSGQQG